MPQPRQETSRATRSANERLNDLARRIERQRAARERRGGKGEGTNRGSAQARAWHLMLRLLTDLSVALLAGVLLGMGLDRLLNTAPWGILVGILLGFAAGVRNVLLTAENEQRRARSKNDMPSIDGNDAPDEGE